MGYLYGVLANEWIKKKNRIFWILGIYALFAIALMVVEWFSANTAPTSVSAVDWHSELEMKLSQLKQYFQTLQTDDPTYRQASGQISIMQHQLEMNIQPEPKGAIHWLNADISGVAIKYIIPLVIIVIGGDMFSGETSSGTMKLLLLSPMGRAKLFWTKLISLFVMSAGLMLFMNVVTFFIGFLRDGAFGFLDPYVVLDASAAPFIMESWEFTIMGLFLNMLTIFTVATVVLFFSLLLSINPSFSVLASFIFVMIIDSILSIMVKSYPIVHYYPMFHLDMLSHFTGNFAGEASLTTSALLLLATSLICAAGGLWRMKSKDFA
ncbi:ABC transporter permease [Candidatus Pristimantibacillus sp. PTI5]|uniref:ABC transporter permease n=1 Tax=Candidatus Pristimantibacillus sp. PTI5 TaxID=3400422 RepID=UPI003B019DC7